LYLIGDEARIVELLDIAEDEDFKRIEASKVLKP
jgi:hypothetical protein